MQTCSGITIVTWRVKFQQIEIVTFPRPDVGCKGAYISRRSITSPSHHKHTDTQYHTDITLFTRSFFKIKSTRLPAFWESFVRHKCVRIGTGFVCGSYIIFYIHIYIYYGLIYIYIMFIAVHNRTTIIIIIVIIVIRRSSFTGCSAVAAQVW